MADTIERKEDGFELKVGENEKGEPVREFFRWAVTDTGKDLMLVDRFARMPVAEFFEIIEDEFDRGRAPILLALIATSIRGKHPDWSVERVERLVLNTPLSEVVFVDSDAEAQPVPPAEGGQEPPTSDEPSNGSSSLSTLEATSPPPTSPETQASSSSPGSPTTSPVPVVPSE